MEISNSTSTEVVGQTGTEAQVASPTNEVVDTASNQEELIPKKDYIALQSESTKWRQGQIDIAVKLASKDINELKDIQDVKVRDAVVKQLTPYSSYEEMVAIEGGLVTSSNAGSELDSDIVLTKRVKQLEYQNEKREFEIAIERVVSQNPSLKGLESEIKEKIGVFAPSIDIQTRVNLASEMVKPKPLSQESEILKNMATSMPQSSTVAGNTKPDAKTIEEQNMEMLLRIQGLK
jgi:hypothetical protein